MAAQADRMGRLIADLLSLSRIELNEHVPPAGEADLTGVARDVADALSPQARARSVATDIVAPAGPASVEGDRDQIVQVVQNLMDNALKYSPEGGRVEVEIETGLTAAAAARPRAEDSAWLSLLTPDRAERRYAAIRVTDRGPGISREHLPRLTERFYRVEGQKSGDRSGTGLGLAIVKHVVNRHRGGLTVESLAGGGTTLCVYLPERGPASAAGPVVRAARPATEAA
jgi:two-component system phosphate regulon sensor histidine kinase PhoR